jgi:hypothetical protein
VGFVCFSKYTVEVALLLHLLPNSGEAGTCFWLSKPPADSQYGFFSCILHKNCNERWMARSLLLKRPSGSGMSPSDSLFLPSKCGKRSLWLFFAFRNTSWMN